MEENLKSEDELLREALKEIDNNLSNNQPGVINKEVPVDPPKDTPVDPPAAPTDSPENKPYWEAKGFASEAELDAIIAAKNQPIKPTYTSKTAEELDAFAKATGKDDINHYNFYKSTEIKENMSSEELVKLIVDKEILDDPDLGKFRNIRIEELSKEFLLDMDENEEGITDQDRYQKMIKGKELKNKAQEVISDITTTREKMANAGLTQADIEAAQAKVSVATKNADDFVKNSTLKIEVFAESKNDKGEIEIAKDKEGNPILLKSYTFGDEENEFFKTTLNGVIKDMIAQTGEFAPDSDNAKLAIQLAEMATERKYRSKMYQEVIAQTEARMIEKHNIKVDNPSVKKVAETPANLEGVLDEETYVRKVMSGG